MDIIFVVHVEFVDANEYRIDFNYILLFLIFALHGVCLE